MSTHPALRAEHVSKTFNGRLVLDDFAITVQAGEIHALLGQNGSGKSTLIKVLAGYQPPDEGARVEANGTPLQFPVHQGDLDAHGFAFVHQSLGLIPNATVTENLLLARYPTGPGWIIPRGRERARVREILTAFGLDIDPAASVDDLSEMDRALLAIVRAFDRLRHRGSGVLVLDEPTAYLPRDGIDRLFGLIREVAAMGLGVILVTHRVEEVFMVCDKVTILRDGRTVAHRDVGSLTEGELVELIVGFPIDRLYPPATEGIDSERLMSTRVAGARLEETSIDLRRGEVVGVTGLIGMGWEELPYLLFGAGRGRGELTIDGTTLDLAHLTPRVAIEAGLALVPANRARDGAAVSLSVRDNFTVTSLGRFFLNGRLRLRREHRATGVALADFEVRPADPQAAMQTLSGGNQQKVVIAKWLSMNPSVLLLHEPTQGIDVGAKRRVFGSIRSAAERGAGVLVASAEYEDLANICDRVLVFRDGQVVTELAGAALTADAVVRHSFAAPLGSATLAAATA